MLLIALFVAPLSAAEPGEGTLRLAILDTAGQPTPAVVSLTNTATKKSHEFGEDRLRRAEVEDYGRSRHGRANRVEWRNEYVVDCDGSLTVALPAGSYRMHVGKGLEHESVQQTIDVRTGREETLSVTLKRFRDFPAEGWWPGDAHVHVTRMNDVTDRNILLSAKAEGIHVINALQVGEVTRTYFHQHAFGPGGRTLEHEHAIVPGQEEPRSHIVGHTLALNTAYFVRNEEPYLVYDKTLRELRQHGALTGYAHVRGFWTQFPPQLRDEFRGMKRNAPVWHGVEPLEARFNADLGLMLDAPEGLVDFVEILEHFLDPTAYYELLNLGFKVPVTGGSDYPFGGHIGDNRTYVFTGKGEPFSVDRWFDGIAKGRTFATQGPLIDFRVEGERPGAILKRKRGDLLTITASVAGHVDAGAPKNVSLVRFGAEIGNVRSDDSSQTSLEGKWTIPVENSCWLAVRVGAHNNAEAHTSPVYVQVDDEPTWDRAQVEALVEKRRAWIRKFRETLARGPIDADAPDAVKGRFERVGEQLESWVAGRAAFLARLERCEKFYEELARKSRR